MANKADCGGTIITASDMTVAEFDAHRRCPNEHYCINPKYCLTRRIRLYPRRRPTGLQEFVHYPGPATERCPDARGETTTHHDMEQQLAAAGERIGLRAEIEATLGRRRPDVSLYRPDQFSTEGPLMVLEAQNSPISAEEFHERDQDLCEALNAFHDPGHGDRRAAAWVFNHNPSALAEAAYVTVDRDAHDAVTGGIYPIDDIEGKPFVVALDKAIQAIQKGGVYKISYPPLTRWVARRGLFNTAPRGKRPRSTRAKPDAEARACQRGLLPDAHPDAELHLPTDDEVAELFQPALQPIPDAALAAPARAPRLNGVRCEFVGCSEPVFVSARTDRAIHHGCYKRMTGRSFWEAAT